jgi:hypothetical protein
MFINQSLDILSRDALVELFGLAVVVLSKPRLPKRTASPTFNVSSARSRFKRSGKNWCGNSGCTA